MTSHSLNIQIMTIFKAEVKSQAAKDFYLADLIKSHGVSQNLSEPKPTIQRLKFVLSNNIKSVTAESGSEWCPTLKDPILILPMPFQ